nr:Gfo/Idh/MocA family oxidoreductase [Actinomycetota bacterium]
MTSKSRIGVGVVGFGWMGQAHSRSVRRLAGIFPGEPYYVELVACSDTDAGRREQAVSDFGFARGEADWQSLAADPDIDVVFITTPNALHVELVEAFSAAGKHVFCEKPVGGTPEQTARAELAARKAGVISAVGYNYRWAPMVQEAKRLINDGVLGRITNYRGRFFSTYGADPSGLLTWRYLVDEGGYGVSSDLLSHSVDLGLYLLGPIARVVGTTATFIPERPLPSAGAVSHYGHGRPGDPTGAVT